MAYIVGTPYQPAGFNQRESELVLKEHFVDLPIIPAIDAHTHFGRMWLGEDFEPRYDTARVVEAMKNIGIKAAWNLDAEYDGYFDRMLRKTGEFLDYLIPFGSVDISRFEQPDFDQYAYAAIKRQVGLGMRGIKIWKALGLKIQDRRGAYLRPDDERLSVIWQTAAEFKLPVLIHIADPTAFFKPIDEKNERFDELRKYPDWSFCKEGLYSFKQLIRMQERLLEANPKTTFVVAHCGSYSENLAKVGEWLDRFANMHVDIAMRINDLGRTPYTSRAFFNKYQDRILFGTDLDPTKLDYYAMNFRFLETFDEYFDYSPPPYFMQGAWKIYGIGLEEDVLEKVYRDNALRILDG